ncbi:GTP-binding protein [Methanosarcinaceae archaeon]|nr:GTP-binding protein [Methanosarcinaceae archaeon]MBQ3620563.1 GTP-binding protein [Methanosarcinaceae archaeon]
MRVLIIGGFLGSGKTTTILKLTSCIISKGLRPAVLTNEIGEIGVDGETLGTSGIATRELTNGCICCTLKYSLHEAIREIEETYHPDILLIEPTGIALPHQIRDEIAEANIMMTFAPIVTIADASRLHAVKGQVPAFMSAQLQEADLIAINKTDAVSPELLARVEEMLRKTNPDAYLFRMSARENSQDIDRLYDIVLAPASALKNKKDDIVSEARTRVNSVEFSNVSSAAVAFKVRGVTDPEKTGSLLSGMISLIAKSAAELNKEFVGHIKTSLSAGDTLIRVSRTSADDCSQSIEYLPRENKDPDENERENENDTAPKTGASDKTDSASEKFICMAAVTNVPEDRLQKITECAAGLFLAVSGLEYEPIGGHHHHCHHDDDDCHGDCDHDHCGHEHCDHEHGYCTHDHDD